MILGSPLSWLLTELVALVLFFVVMAHAVRQEDPVCRVLELFAFIVSAAIFENIGVGFAHAYSYDLRRVMMIGAVPLEILLLEAVIWYAAFNLTARLGLPRWAQPFVVGLLGSVQDLTIDPPAVFDRYALTDPAQIAKWNALYPGSMGNGALSGQWNWTNPGYDNLLFGIPFYNFSGWLTLMGYFTVFVLLGRWLSRKSGSKSFSYILPFIGSILTVVAIVSPLNRLFLFAYPFALRGDRTAEMVMLCINYAFPLALLALFRNRHIKGDLKRDGLVVFGIPILLHSFDIVYAFALGTRIAYLPVLAVSAVHIAYLAFLFRAFSSGPFQR